MKYYFQQIEHNQDVTLSVILADNAFLVPRWQEGTAEKEKDMNRSQNKPDLAAICITAFILTCAGCVVFGLALLIAGKV